MKLYILICCTLLAVANDKVFQSSSQDTNVTPTFKPVVYGMTIDPKTGKRTCGIINRNPNSSNSGSQSNSPSIAPESVPKEILQPPTPQLVPSNPQETSPQISSEDSTITLQLEDNSGSTESLSSTNLRAEDSIERLKTLQARENLEILSEDSEARKQSDENALDNSSPWPYTIHCIIGMGLLCSILYVYSKN
jgi:hypothetical protein